MTNKTIYRASVTNASGAGEYAGQSTSLSQLKRDIRAKYGKGWTVNIWKSESDEGGGWFAPQDVETFVIRGK